MSKIIKEGELPVKRVKCDYCGCEFEYDKRDVEILGNLHGEGVTSGSVEDILNQFRSYHIACPYCHTFHPLPAGILDQLKAKNPIKDFAENAKALAAQYGLEIEDIKFKD